MTKLKKEESKKSESKSNRVLDRYKIRPRAGDWGFIVRGKGKPQNVRKEE